MAEKKSGNEELGHYLKLLRIKCNLTMIQTAKATGITQGYISQIENGIYTPSAKTLSKLARAYNVAELTLLRKAGIVQYDDSDKGAVTSPAMFSGDIFSEESRSDLTPDQVIQLLQRGIESLEQLTFVSRQKQLAQTLPEQPIEGSGQLDGTQAVQHLQLFDAAWKPLLNTSGAAGVFSLPAAMCNHDREAFILVVGDNSMFPTISCGDWVVVSPAAKPENGNLVVINDRNTLCVRSYSVVGDSIVLSVTNTDFSSRQLSGKAGDQSLEIVGRIIRVVNHEF